MTRAPPSRAQCTVAPSSKSSVSRLKILYDKLGIDVWEVVDAAKSKPFGYQAFYPGPGLGGHCIPVDPFYLSWWACRVPQQPAQADQRQPHRHPGCGLQEGRGRPALKPVVRADEVAAGTRCRAVVQRSAHPRPAEDAALRGSPRDSQRRAHARVPGSAGLRADCHRPLCFRLRFHCRTFEDGARHEKCHEARESRARKNSESLRSHFAYHRDRDRIRWSGGGSVSR